MSDNGIIERHCEAPFDEIRERAMVLLSATLELFNRQKNSRYVLNMLDETVEYDDAECDGYCLASDIEILIESFVEMCYPTEKP